MLQIDQASDQYYNLPIEFNLFSLFERKCLSDLTKPSCTQHENSFQNKTFSTPIINKQLIYDEQENEDDYNMVMAEQAESAKKKQKTEL